MNNHPHLSPYIQLPDQETASLEFGVIGNNGKLEVLVSAIGVHKHLSLDISYETWIDGLIAQDVLIPNGNAFYMELENQFYLTLDAAIGIAEKANTGESPELLQWLIESRDKDAPEVIARIIAEQMLEVEYGAVH